MTNDSIFFQEWRDRNDGETRSIERARALAERLRLTDLRLPLLTLVGSKGKGTAATYASAYLAAAGHHVVTVTSPSYRSDRERIRVNGQAISAAGFADLAALLEDHIRMLPEHSAHGGYLSPVGLFTLAGLTHARDIGADAVVLEAGQGGRSDEISLFAPTVVGLAEIFAEHLGQLGPHLDAIAVDKADSLSEKTRAVVSLPQTGAVRRTLNEAIALRTHGRLQPEIVTPLSSGIPVSLLAPGISQANSELGLTAAQRLLDVTTHSRPQAPHLIPTLKSVRIPGRLSCHPVPGGSTELLADSAINRAGIAVALATIRGRWKELDHVLLCLPDHKDLSGAVFELADLPVTFVRLPDRHLRFERRLPDTWQVLDADDLTPELLSGLGRRVLALGTVYFIGRILELVEAETEHLWS